MKNFLFIFLLILPLYSFPQVYKLKVFRTKLAFFDGEDWKTKGVNETSFLAVINLDKDKIQTYGKKFGDYDIIKIKKSEVDEDGGVFAMFDGIDENGENCAITLSIFSEKIKIQSEDGAIASLGIRYGDRLLVFYMKKDD